MSYNQMYFVVTSGQAWLMDKVWGKNKFKWSNLSNDQNFIKFLSPDVVSCHEWSSVVDRLNLRKKV